MAMTILMKISSVVCCPFEVSRVYKGSFTTLLELLLLISPLVAQAQFTYTTNADNTLTITGYTGDGGAVTIPTNIEGLTVTSIGFEAFIDKTTVTSVTFPGSVTSAGYGAFEGCYWLTSVTMSDSLTKIADLMFNMCLNLTNAPIPPSVTSIGEDAFDGTALSTLTIPTNVTSIGAGAFCDCTALTNAVLYGITTLGDYALSACTSLESVTLPATITEIIGNPFGYCPSLTEVFFMGNGPVLLSGMPDSGEPFSDNPNVTVYYLPGTSNWTFLTDVTGVKTVLWNPLIQTGNGNFGVQNNQFGFDITGTPAIPIVVEASTNLANPVWSALTNVTLTNGLFHFSEPLQAGSPTRYYRIGSP